MIRELFFSTLAQAEVIDRIIAKVGSDVITLSDVAQAIGEKRAYFFEQYGPVKGAEKFNEFKANALEELIQQKILANEVKNEGIQVTDSEVDQEFQNRLNQFHMTQQELLAQLNKQGLSILTFKKNLREEIEKQRFIQKKIVPKINISDYDLQQEYDKHPEKYQTFSKFRFIEVVLTQDKFANADEMQKTAKLIESKLKSNQSASELIKKYSSGAFATNGGDSGLIEASSLRGEIQGVLSKLNIGQTSPIFPSEEGTFIFKLLGKSDPKPLPYAQVANQIRANYGDKLVNDELKKYLMAARDQLYVEILK